MKVIENVKSKDMWPTTAYTFIVNNIEDLTIDNEYIKNNFPHISILRMDRDSTNLHNSHEKILNEFSRGDAQVLIGTQMITKGLHFPNVNLVGALSADVGLGLPDFTSNERVFQLLCQVVGRSGRGISEGIGILQTLQPEHHSVISASSQDYETVICKTCISKKIRLKGNYIII